MRRERSRRTLSSVEQERGWPSQIGTRPSRFLKQHNLRGFAVVALQDSTEFAFATNLTFGFWNKGIVKNGVVSTDTAMGPLLMIMFEPHANDVVELSSTEANKVVQHLAFCGTDEAFCKRVRLGSPWTYANASHAWFPELVELVRIL